MDPEMLTKLATMPENLQIIVGCGYLAYLISYVGIRHAHKPVDAICLTITFGLIATVAVSQAPDVEFRVRLALALGASIAAGAFWRLLGRKLVRWCFRWVGYSASDDTASAWDHILEETKAKPIQLTVETGDGWQYFCTDTRKLRGLPFNPYVLGTNGDVIMYADHTQGPGEDTARLAEFSDPTWGSNATYLPASQIRRIMIRYAPPTSWRDRAVLKALRAVVSGAAKLLRFGSASRKSDD